MSQPFPDVFEQQVVYLAAKRTMLRMQSDRIDTLVLGSSHGDFGFDPAYVPGSFNACCRSQDLKHSFRLYEAFAQRYDTIHTVVMFYSVFSSGWILERSRAEGPISVALNEVFCLGMNYHDPHLAELNACVEGKLDEISVDVPGRSGFLPEFNKGFMPANLTTEKRVSDHMRFYNSSVAVEYLDDLLELAGRNGHRVIVVTPPVRSDFRRIAGENLFGAVRNRLGQHRAKLLDLYRSELFADEDFGDMDHLRPLGSGVSTLSSLVWESIR